MKKTFTVRICSTVPVSYDDTTVEARNPEEAAQIALANPDYGYNGAEVDWDGVGPDIAEVDIPGGGLRYHHPAGAAERAAEDMLGALKAVAAWLSADNVGSAPLSEKHARLAKAWINGAIGARVNAAIAKATDRFERWSDGAPT